MRRLIRNTLVRIPLPNLKRVRALLGGSIVLSSEIPDTKRTGFTEPVLFGGAGGLQLTLTVRFHQTPDFPD